MTDRVRIYEVGPRDGLQNEATPLPTETKLRFIELLVAAGLREIEATSFVAPTAIPQLADADELLPSLPARARRPLPGPRPEPARPRPGRGGRRRRDRRLHRGDRRVHRRSNIGMTVEESLAAFAPVLARAGELGWWRRGYVSTAFGCPYTGAVDAGARRRGRAAAARARRRRGLLRRHDRRRRPGPGRAADRAGGRAPGSPSSGSRTTSTTRAGRPSPTSRRASPAASAASTRRPAAPAAVRTPRARPAISRPRTSSTSSTPSGYEHGVDLERRPRRRAVHRRRARQAARDEGRPGRRLGSRDGPAGRALTAHPLERRAANPQSCTIRHGWTASCSC